jgi:ribosomal protein L40E
VQKCSSCDCPAQPWWYGIRFPSGEEYADLISELNDDPSYFPATKAKLEKSFSDWGMGASLAELESNLPERTYSNAGDFVSALIENSPPIKWEQKQTDILWRYPSDALGGGQRLVVAENQQAVLVSDKTGKACDVLNAGKYTLSRQNSPLLASQSRKSLPGFDHDVLNGSVVFYSPEKEFEIALSVMGQTKALRRVLARGVVRVRISSAERFFGEIAAKNRFESQASLSALQKYCEAIVTKEILSHEMEELTGDPSILESVLKSGLVAAGLEPIKVGFDSVGEFGPGAFAMPTAANMNDPKRYEQMKQMAESLRATQMERIQAMQQQMQLLRQQQQAAYSVSKNAQQQVQTVSCSSCGATNPGSSKFCNNCGKPLLQPAAAQKKICPKCGKQLDSGINFCGNCGTKVV